MNRLPTGIAVAWYGDDFTGAAAVMEVLAFAGVKAMLFFEPPTQQLLAAYPDLQAVGVASTARARSPDWMRRHLPAAFRALADLAPQLLHYKICSTLDSAPDVGSIGCAIEIGADLAGVKTVPVLVAAPQMGRIQIAGELFAEFKGEMYRLDQHPVMSCHPVTPMTEPRPARHIALQSRRIAPQDGADITLISIDCSTDNEERAVGEAIWQDRAEAPFVVGSQGVEYALVRHWIAAGLLEPCPLPAGIGRAKGMVTVSGSVSPVTAEQIAWSRVNGFATIRFNALAACQDDAQLQTEIEQMVEAALAALRDGKDPLIYTAEGPKDPAVKSLTEQARLAGLGMEVVNRRLGDALGRVLDAILRRSDVTRAIVSGGDTSGYAMARLGVFALSALAPTIPGAALFRAHADGPRDGLELALKGGQMGSPDYFGWIRDGGGQR
ncbi:four-carbon acid sugar kinase family protein [Tritonibacter horizontis]|uniref:four-carbon acid sugar kinase family protein n=1 Tax=Tritonibacter horizontis TaxID=1768241 RepID=UPI00082E9E03|nr:four-carbon acid sugar kinase family protein [Tritonibacter horizontis]